MSNVLSSVVLLPPDARSTLRRHLKLDDCQPLRVTYIPGPGDVVGTFAHWHAGRHEPRVPTVAYSLMFYELMSQLDAEAQIISIHPFDGSNVPASDRFHFEYLYPKPASGLPSYIQSRSAYARELVSLTNRFDPHVVVTATYNPSIAWRRLSKDRKLILSAHNTFWPMGHPPRDLKRRLRTGIVSWQTEALDAAICTSHECARQLYDMTAGRLPGRVEYPQIIERYSVEQREKARKLLFLGRILRSKGVFLLLDAFDRLAERHADLSLVIAGSGDAEGDVETRLAKSPHSDRISFLGRIDSDAVHREIAAADLLICPTMTSFNEGLALVGFEAAAHGIPSVLSSIVPAADLLEDSCTVFEADNENALCNALSTLVEKPEFYLEKCLATVNVRDNLYDRSHSWGSELFHTMMSA